MVVGWQDDRRSCALVVTRTRCALPACLPLSHVRCVLMPLLLLLLWSLLLLVLLPLLLMWVLLVRWTLLCGANGLAVRALDDLLHGE